MSTISIYQEGYTDGFEDARKKYERPHGEWIENVETSCGKILRWRANVIEQKCNKCNRYTLRWSDTLTSEFCSNCGAKMGGIDK